VARRRPARVVFQSHRSENALSLNCQDRDTSFHSFRSNVHRTSLVPALCTRRRDLEGPKRSDHAQPFAFISLVCGRDMSLFVFDVSGRGGGLVSSMYEASRSFYACSIEWASYNTTACA
jgi:hypothetical protein